MKIPSHQLHHSINEGDIFEANGFDFVCTGRDEEYLYCERLIYENDIPPKIKMKCRPEKRLKNIRKFGRERWKPNGITNNIEEWERKSGLHGNPDRHVIHQFNCEHYKQFNTRIDWNLSPI